MSQHTTQLDTTFMARALTLAAQTHPTPNPKVGAVLVKNGHVIAESAHVKPGDAHAERTVLEEAGTRARGATLYVTLEPCVHYGRTPPCTDIVLSSGIARAVIAMKDPNPIVNGRGLKALRHAGIKTTVDVLQEEAASLNETYLHFTRYKTPFVCIKTAMSLDGKIATRTGDSRGLSGKRQQHYVHLLRADYDAIAVGINTIAHDNPSLTCRAIRGCRDPLRVILDSTLRISLRSHVVRDKHVIIATTNRAPQKKRDMLEKKGVEVVTCGTSSVQPKILLKALASRGITSLLVEGGGEVNASFLNARCVQKMIISIAPKIIGGRHATTLVEGAGVAHIKDALAVAEPAIAQFGNDIVITGYL